MSGLRRLARRLIPEPPPPIPSGLYPYRFEEEDSRTTLHLRIEAGGEALLFVNGSEVLHLNPTAAELAKGLLDGVDNDRLVRRMRDRWLVDQTRLAADLTRVQALLDRVTRPTENCPYHGLEFKTAAPFSRRGQAPYKADLVMGYSCNNRCSHCYNEASRRLGPSDGLPQWITILERLRQVGVPHLILTGGEPTLYPELRPLVGHAHGLGFIVGLNTNGRRLAQPGYAADLRTAGLDHLQVTLESHDPQVHDSMVGARAWEQTVAGIRNARAVGLHLITNTTLTRRNAPGIHQTLDFLHRAGIRTFAANAMIHSGSGRGHPQALSEQQLQPVLQRIRDRALQLGMRFLWYTPTEYCRLNPLELEIGAKRCNAAEYSIAIEADGEVLPCQSWYHSCGNILRDPWERIWNSELFLQLRRRSELPPECRDCPDLELCGGGCPIERAEREGVPLFDGSENEHLRLGRTSSGGQA